MENSDAAGTRWQEYRSRRYPLRKQLRISASLLLGIFLYAYSVLALQPFQAHEVVMRTQVERHNAWQVQQLERKAKKRGNLRASSRANGVDEEFMDEEEAGGPLKSKPRQSVVSRLLSTLFSPFTILFVYIYLRRRALPYRNETSPARRGGRRVLTQQDRNNFRRWVTRLNRQRAAQGERPLSAEALRLVLRERDFEPTDYEGLLDFAEQSGGIQAAMGMTDEEIARCPTRVIEDPNDDLLTTQGPLGSCAVCLESYRLGEAVRTIPCFHTFHRQCIDPWLRHKAVCPICKHPAVA